jgi:hypothetical protein
MLEALRQPHKRLTRGASSLCFRCFLLIMNSSPHGSVGEFSLSGAQ